VVNTLTMGLYTCVVSALVYQTTVKFNRIYVV
jgi:hypothetical protein